MSTDLVLPSRPRLVVVESPYAGLFVGDTVGIERNLKYLRACMRDCFRRGEYPYASHGLYTQAGVLDDDDPKQRKLGIEAGFAWGAHADLVVFYVDYGWSKGMSQALERLMELRDRAGGADRATAMPWEERLLGGEW